MSDLKEVHSVDDIIVGKWYHVQHINFENLTRVLQAHIHGEGVKALDKSGCTIWLDKAHEKEVFSKFKIKELPAFDNLKFTSRDKAIEKLRTNEALEKENIELKSQITKLEKVVEAANAMKMEARKLIMDISEGGFCADFLLKEILEYEALDN